MPTLNTLSIHGFKSIRAIDQLKLGQINLVIGANGAGKSNFIGVFDLLHAIRDGRLNEYVAKMGGADKVLYFGAKVTSKIVIHISFDDDINQYRIELHPSVNDELLPINEIIYYLNKRSDSKPYQQNIDRIGNEAGISGIQSKGVANFIRKHLNSWRIYHFQDTGINSPMKKTADINDNRFLRPDGANLAAFLYRLQQQASMAYSLIRRSIQLVAPFFDDFVLEPQALNPDKIRLVWRHRRSEAYFDAASLSDGTLRFMALATLFLQPEDLRPSIILVDEPELGLHPYAVTLLANLVKQASINNQVIVSTQSSLLLDHFQPEDVLVADRVEGSTQFTRLDVGKLSEWLNAYSLGQLWEKNEIGGRPTSAEGETR